MYVNSKKSLFWALALTVVLSTATTLAAPPEGKGKDKGEDPPPPVLPSINYRIHYFGVPNSAGFKFTNDINNLGQAVGSYVDEFGQYRGYLYDPHDTENSGQAVDLNDIASVPDYVISTARGINDLGLIVGGLKRVVNPNTIDPHRVNYRAFILNYATNPPTMEMIPETPGHEGQGARARDVNENGDVACSFWREDGTRGVFLYNSGVYNPLDANLEGLDAVLRQPYVPLNNPTATRPAQIVGQLADESWFRWTPNEPLETFYYEDWRNWPRGLNDSGTFCGASWVSAKGNKGYTLPFRFNTAPIDPEYLLDAEWSSPTAINSSGDLSGYYTGVHQITPWLHHDGWGSINVLGLITGSTDDLELWNTESESHEGINVSITDINDRDTETDFGQLLGELRFEDGSEILFILTPEPAP